MLEVFSIQSNAKLTEKELYVPPSVAALILVSGITGSGHDVVARAIRSQPQKCCDWNASLALDRALAALSCIGIQGGWVDPLEADITWFMGELGHSDSNPADELAALLSHLQCGAQVIAYIHAVDPIIRMKSMFEKCDQEQAKLLERLIAARGCRTIEVTRPERRGDVYVKTTGPADRLLRLAIDNTANVIQID